MGTYVKKTSRRRYADRTFSVRPVHRDAPDLHKLCEVLIRMTLEETGRSRAQSRAAEAPETYRPHEAPASETDSAARVVRVEQAP